MPIDAAKRIAQVLAEDPDQELTVDLHNDGFSDRVAEALQEMGLRVTRHDTKPHRLTVEKPPERQAED